MIGAKREIGTVTGFGFEQYHPFAWAVWETPVSMITCRHMSRTLSCGCNAEDRTPWDSLAMTLCWVSTRLCPMLRAMATFRQHADSMHESYEPITMLSTHIRWNDRMRFGDWRPSELPLLETGKRKVFDSCDFLRAQRHEILEKQAKTRRDLLVG